jgi:signal transduction histidine kinase
MQDTEHSISSLVSTALGQSNLSGLSEMLKSVALSMKAFGAILWQVVPGTDLTQEPCDGYLFVLASWFQDERTFALHNLPVARSVTGIALRSPCSINVKDIASDERVYKRDQFLATANIRTMCAVPVTFCDGARGSLNFYRNTPDPFDEKDVLKMERLASLIADLYQAILDRVSFRLIGRVNETIQKAEVHTSSIPDSKARTLKSLQAICDLISESFQCAETSIFMEDRLEKPGLFTLQATTWQWSLKKYEYSKKAKDGLTSWILNHGRAVRILDLDYFDRDKDRIQSDYKGITWEDSLDYKNNGRKYLRKDGRVPPLSFMAAPILSGKNVLGVIRCSAATREPYYFAERELTLLTYLAAQISQFWSNWLNLREMQEENKSWKYLIEIIGQLNSFAHKELTREKPDEQRIFAEALRVTSSVIQGAEVMDVRLLDEQTQELVFAQTHGTFWTEGSQSEVYKRLHRRFSLQEKSAGAHVFNTGEVRLMSNVEKDQYYSGTFKGIKGMIIAPIKIEDKKCGVLDIRSTGEAEFPRHAKSIAELLGQQLGVYHYLATTIRDLHQAQGRLNAHIRALKKLQDQQTQIFEDLKHQLYGPINQAHARIQALLKEEYPNIHTHLDEGTISPTELSLLRIRGLCGRTRRVTKNTGLLADLSRGKKPELSYKRLQPEYLTSLLVNIANDNKLMIDPEYKIGFHVDRDSFKSLRVVEYSADYDLLEQAIMNIVDNAFKYSSRNTVVRIASGVSGTRRFYISVSNEGTPIRPKDVPRSVERGWRSELAKWTTGEGAGIGLWIVHNIMKAHDGDLEITPTAGGRTEVKLLIPAPK